MVFSACAITIRNATHVLRSYAPTSIIRNNVSTSIRTSYPVPISSYRIATLRTSATVHRNATVSSSTAPPPHHDTTTTNVTENRNDTLHESNAPQADNNNNNVVFAAEDVNAPLRLSQRCIKQLRNVNARRITNNQPLRALRVVVESGGCHGFQVKMCLVPYPSTITVKSKETNSTKNKLQQETTTKDETLSANAAVERRGFNSTDDVLIIEGGVNVLERHNHSNHVAAAVIVDRCSLDLVRGAQVDYVEELIGSSFQVIDNPNAESSCGCKVSFGIKF